MLDKAIESALNQQINNELRAWYEYLFMSAQLDTMHFKGFASFMEAQAREEQEHAHRVLRYLLDREGTLDLAAIGKPSGKFDTVEEIFRRAVESERGNTKAIHDLYELAREKGDYATLAFLQWFVDEQVEEEKIMGDALGLIEFAGNDKSALLTLNREFGERRAENAPEAN